MLTFLNSIILSILGAALLPLLIHLINKRRTKKIKFSSIRFLKLLERQRLKKLKLYQLLLIFIRTLVILFIILAFARPTLTGDTGLPGGTARTTAVIVLDNGMNMLSYDQSGNRFFRTKEKLNQILENYSNEDQVFTIPTVESKDSLTIDFTNATYSKSNWQSAFIRANKIFINNPNYNKELFIISDFQFQNKKFISSLSELSGINAYLIKIGAGPISNVALDTLFIKSRLFELNKTINLEALLQNFSENEAEDTEIHLFVNEQRVAYQRFVVNPDADHVVSMSFKPKEYGMQNCYLEINDDDLLADNRFYFALNIPKEIKVLFVDNNLSSFLRAALESIELNSNITISNENYSSWARQNFNQFHVIFLSDIPNIDNTLQQRLKSYLNQGGSLIIMPGPQTIPSEFNRSISKINSAFQLDNLISVNSSDNYFTMRKPDKNHPIFEGIFRASSSDLNLPKFYKYFKIRPSINAESILSFQNNDPLLIKSKTSNGSLFLLSSFINETWTDFQFKGIFLPLFLRLFHLGASSSAQIQKNIIVGAECLLNIDQTLSGKNYVLELPSSEKNKINPSLVDQTLTFSVNQLNAPGNYKLYSEEENIKTVSVNISSSAYPFLNMDDVRSKLERLQIFEEEEDFKPIILQARFGKELWSIFVILVLLFIAIEIVVIKKIEGNE